ncbi:hypothetical protein EDB85DRAFT_1901813 [Lactarius pseudohatsudake]|nr:hypothetical protein EDB85DRAFT_1901813 [Lactarius pseudohatsudake]
MADFEAKDRAALTPLYMLESALGRVGNVCDGSWGIGKAVRGVSGLRKTFAREKSQTRELSPEVLCEGRATIAKERPRDRAKELVVRDRGIKTRVDLEEVEEKSAEKVTSRVSSFRPDLDEKPKSHERERGSFRKATNTFMLFQIVLYLLRAGWRLFEEKVVCPAENLMRRLGIRVEIDLHAQVVVSHRGRRLFDDPLGPWHLVFPRDELAPVAGRETAHPISIFNIILAK